VADEAIFFDRDFCEFRITEVKLGTGVVRNQTHAGCDNGVIADRDQIAMSAIEEKIIHNADICAEL
jgi:hypothetical protein